MNLNHMKISRLERRRMRLMQVGAVVDPSVNGCKPPNTKYVCQAALGEVLKGHFLSMARMLSEQAAKSSILSLNYRRLDADVCA